MMKIENVTVKFRRHNDAGSGYISQNVRIRAMMSVDPNPLKTEIRALS